EPDLLDNIIRIGLDTKIVGDFLWSIDYVVDFVGFPFDKNNEYTVNEIETGLRQDISDRLYQKIIYSFSHKHYPKRKTRNRGGVFRLGDREDTRNTFEHQLGLYLTDRTFVETENSIYFNNSNELYLDYYDYTSVKTKAGVVHLITDKLYGSANAGYQYKAYKNRSASGSSKDQADHLLMCGTSIFYDITPALSIGTNFDYRKNFSNEGEQKYTDYIMSGGLYARF
ncbi:MAG: hypothetical protein U9R52_02085, partial [Candidatus Omnitrophota bacterium]|nr:hypothetical protein [Candidatus Omnitrophota bacterium]